MKKITVVRGKFLNRYEMQFYEPLAGRYKLTAIGSLSPFHDRFAFPVIKLLSPMDLPEFPYKMPLMNRLFTDAHYLYGLERAVAGSDLVHTAETYYRYTQQALDAKKRGLVRKVIATVLETIPHNNEGIRGRKEYKARARAELDHMIALTEKAKHALVSEGADPGKITVIHHYIDTSRFAPEPHSVERIGDTKRRRLTILFTGRLEEYKGVFDLLDAADILSRDRELDGYTVDMVFVGSGNCYRAMRAIERDIAKNWHFTHVSAKYLDMPAWYRNADIFVAPSKPRVVTKGGVPVVTWEEQYCTALLEAQAAGLPIVTTESGGIPENVGDAALMVRPGDPPALAAAVKRFMLNGALRKTYALRARNRALRTHDIRLGSEKLAALYDRILTS